METPVIFIIFNRPDNAGVVFEKIREAKPKKLYVVADGPRENKFGEKEKCEETRKIIEKIDWDCEVIKDYSEINLGCDKRVTSGITNAFQFFESAIILEDDCVPNASFFRFCEEMLEKYKNDERIMTVSGNNFLFEKKTIIKDSYYFSAYSYIWGWATWKRAWNKHDREMTACPNIGKNTWDIQWAFSCMNQKGLTIIPRENLVSNIGFGKNSTHTKIKSQTANMATYEMDFPLSHPKLIMKNEIADKISSFRFTKIGIILGIIKKFIKK